MLSDAFKTVLALQGHSCDYSAYDGTELSDITMAKANIDRMRVAIDTMTEEGTEFVVAKDAMGAVEPRRGDIVKSSIMGEFSVKMVIPQIALGELIGYRLRC